MEKLGIRSLNEQYAEQLPDFRVEVSQTRGGPQPDLALNTKASNRVQKRSSFSVDSANVPRSANSFDIRKRSSENDASHCCRTFRRSRAWLLGESYTYKPLPEGPWIRMLTLWSGVESDPIRCSLHDVLHEHVYGKYDAVSYVWNSRSLSTASHRTIHIDDGTFKIRENLFQFLMAARSVDTDLELWIDAICIDQSNTSEKNHQVRQMANIYKYARQTRVWLGQPNPCIEDCLRWYQWRADAIPKTYNKDVIISAFSGFPSFLEEPGVVFTCDEEYWNRLWIVQEIILSRAVRIQILRQLVEFEYMIAFTNMHGDFGARFQPRGSESRMFRIRIERGRVGRSKRQLHTLIRDFSRGGCFDDRDRVFGLLGLVEEDIIQVDYGLSRLELFSHVMKSLPLNFLHELAGPLAFALRIPDDTTNIDADSPSTVPIKLLNTGFVIRLGERLTWSYSPDCLMLVHSFGDECIRHGDTVYSLRDSLGGSTASALFLIALRQVPQLRPQNSGYARYKVAGTLFVFHPGQDERSLTATFGKGINEIARGAHARIPKHAQRHLNDPLDRHEPAAGNQAILDLPIADFAKMRWARWSWGCFQDAPWR